MLSLSPRARWVLLVFATIVLALAGAWVSAEAACFPTV
jgi:hypothetical protein